MNPKFASLSTTAALVAASLIACSDRPTRPTEPALRPAAGQRLSASSVSTAQLVRQLAAGRGIVALRRTAPVRAPLVKLGQALLFDPVLSGNRDIACATCHLPAFATGDGRSLSVGQGASGLGPSRVHPQGVFIARNAPPLFNLGAQAPVLGRSRRG